jgi:hypothetical protein
MALFANKQILLTIMSGAFGLAGWHFSRNPTSSSSENPVAIAADSEPWKTGGDAKYQYHPGGDTSKPRKDAPSALNEVIVPNVNLPRVSSRQLRYIGYIMLIPCPGASREVQQVGQGRLLEKPIMACNLYRYLNSKPTFLPSPSISRFYDL